MSARVHYPPTWRLDLGGSAILQGVHDRAKVMTSAARLLAARGGANVHQGRGPLAFDVVGFVRACVQAAADFNPDFGRWAGAAPAVADLDGYRETGATLDEARTLVEAWGLKHHHWADAQPGDVILHMGRGPVMTVMTQRGGLGEARVRALAGVWQCARIDEQPTHFHHTVAAYRWPTAPSGGRREPWPTAAAELTP